VGFSLSDAWDAVTDTAEDVGEAVVDRADEVWDKATSAAEDAWNEAASVAEDAWDEASNIADDAWEWASEKAGDAWDEIAESAEDAWGAATNFVEEHWPEGAAAVEGAVDFLKDVAEDAWEAATKVAEAAWEAVGSVVEAAWDKVAAFAEDAWNKIAGGVEAAWDAFTDFVRDARGALVALYERSMDLLERSVEWLGELAESIKDFLVKLGACLGGLIVYAICKADNVVFNIDRLPKQLSLAFRAKLTAFFHSESFGDVWFIDRAHLSANYFNDDTDGMTFGGISLGGFLLNNLIFLRPAFDESRVESRRLIIHELVHVTQYRRFANNEEAFACAYGIGYEEAGFDYAKNPLEQAAYGFVDAHAAAIAAI
jgi:hypothetical protein